MLAPCGLRGRERQPNDRYKMSDLLPFHGANAGYALELFERFQNNPASVDAETRALFESGVTPELDAPSSAPAAVSVAPPPASAPLSAAPILDVAKIVGAARLGRLVRELGHLDAHIDPLGSPPPGDPSLLLETHGLTDADLAALPASVIGGPCADGAQNAGEALARLRAVYSGSVGYEDDHIQIAEERAWLRDAVETGRFFAGFTTGEKRDILERLTEVDTFEQFLQTTPPFQGQKRFSIEGCDVMVPVLDAIIRCSAQSGTREVVMGMAHRGRLNVLAHVLGKPYAAILGEFPNPSTTEAKPSVAGTGAIGYSGDVKYHKGYRRRYTNDDGGPEMPITLAPNPSHLEFVNPAVVGRARAAQETRNAPGAPVQDIKASLAILIHGDAAFPGQGVVSETLNLSQLAGYRVGGTLHIIANNQIGFTTSTGDARSTLYSSDLAKGFEIPIVHVNGDDPVACIAVARMACAYHQTFGKDFLIDLVGYRRLGHNEGDEPAFTQPRMYEMIRRHPRPREVWAKTLIEDGIVTQADADELVQTVRARLTEAKNAASNAKNQTATEQASRDQTDNAAAPVANVSADDLASLNVALHSFPPGFTPDPKLEKNFVQPRRTAFERDGGVSWAHAEALALGTLLQSGTPVRLTGQDTERGTFTQRHLVFHDPETGQRRTPLESLPDARASLALFNSPLSETAALGFEYGYSVHATDTLVLWEAQFGDFANGAQIIIDQFIASGASKWGQAPSLVLLLPHGYEGQGPEHSSARLERFLQLCANDNMRVANCTTAAQYFHLLRRQGAQLQSGPRPLVIMTPKSLLRHPRTGSSLADLVTGSFQAVLPDARDVDAARRNGVTRLVLCSGKLYIDLAFGPGPQFAPRPEFLDALNVSVARVEELYPFPSERLAALVAEYPHLREVVWAQEEPRNMGAWTFAQPRLLDLLPGGVRLRYIGRAEAASPAEGSIGAHDREQKRIIAETLGDAPVPSVASATANGAASNGKNGKNGRNGAKAAAVSVADAVPNEITLATSQKAEESGANGG